MRELVATVVFAVLDGRVLLRVRVHVGSFFGVWVEQVRVSVVVIQVFEFIVTLASVFVATDVVERVTAGGVIITNLVIVVDGTVVLCVIAIKVVLLMVVYVEVVVVDGVRVTLKKAVGVAVIVICGPAMMVKVRIHAKVRPWITMMYVPDIMLFLYSGGPAGPSTLLEDCHW